MPRRRAKSKKRVLSSSSSSSNSSSDIQPLIHPLLHNDSREDEYERQHPDSPLALVVNNSFRLFFFRLIVGLLVFFIISLVLIYLDVLYISFYRTNNKTWFGRTFSSLLYGVHLIVDSLSHFVTIFCREKLPDFAKGTNIPISCYHVREYYQESSADIIVNSFKALEVVGTLLILKEFVNFRYWWNYLLGNNANQTCENEEEIQKHRESLKHVRVSIQINVMAKNGTLFVRTVHECGLLDFFTERLDPWIFSKIFQSHNQCLTQAEDTFVRIKEEMFDGHQISWGKIESGERMSKADLKTRISDRLSDQMRQRLSFLLGGSQFVSLAAKYDDHHFLQEQAKFDFGLIVVRSLSLYSSYCST